VLPQAASNRIVRFEVATSRNGRWIIDSLRPSEEEAIDVARNLLASDKYDAVRVVRQRQTPTEWTLETQVFEAKAGARGKAPMRLGELGDPDAWCATLGDLYGGRSRRAIGQLLRNFLDRYEITATELLHNHRFIRKLEDSDSLLMSAVHRVARARQAAAGTSATEAVRSLDRLIAEATRRAQVAFADRSLPMLGVDGPDALLAACRKRSGDLAEQAFLLRYAVSRHFEAAATLLARLDAALGWSGASNEPAIIELIDELIADCLGQSEIFQEMLGAHADRGGALELTIDLVRGRCERAPIRAPGWFTSFNQLLSSRAMPETRAILLARLSRELADERPLTRGGRSADAKALTRIADRLKDDSDGTYFGGAEIVVRLAKRWRDLDLPGGMGDLPSLTGSLEERAAKLLGYARTAFGEPRKRTVATLLLSILRESSPEQRPKLGQAVAAGDVAGLRGAARIAVARELGITA
jgi:hypothetical protein